MTTKTQPREAIKKEPLLVTPDNFNRAESDMYFNKIVTKEKALGKFNHHRELFSVDDQLVVRPEILNGQWKFPEAEVVG